MNKILFSFLLFFPIITYCQLDYNALTREIFNQREILVNSYNNATVDEKDSIVTQAREFLFQKITTEIFPLWYGTPWDFNGHSRVPRQGNIACGYFVTNILLDAGFNIPRFKWAQSASEVFIKALAPKNLKRFHNKPLAEVADYLKRSGTGLYVVGLDCHVGYIVVNGDEIRFVHSNFYQPDIGVMAEEIDSENPLKHSKYRIIGKLLTNEMIEKWLTNSAYN